MPSFDPNRPWRHLYGAKWRKRRDRFLDKHPLCVMCSQVKRVTPANVVDHVVAHKGDPVLFWNEGNWQALCSMHHSSHKQRAEHGNAVVECGGDGYPIDGSW